MESSVVLWYTHHHIELIVSELKEIYFMFKYQNRFSPEYKISSRLSVGKHISMYTLFKKERPIELETWFTYYTILGVEHFMMYYNGNSMCINPANCKCSSVDNSSCGSIDPCMKMACFIQQIATVKNTSSNTTAQVVPLHSILSSASFEFIAWNYIYERHVPKSVTYYIHLCIHIYKYACI